MDPYARVAAADVEVLARAAAAFDLPWACFEASHEWIAGVEPDLRERPVFHIAEAVVPPEGIGVDLAEVVDVGDVHAR